MDQVFETLSSPQFRQAMYSLSIICLFLAIGIVLVAFSYYARARDVCGASSEKQRWTLLIGTWRDSLIITLLYISESMLYRWSDFRGVSEVMETNLLVFSPVVLPMFTMVLNVLMFMVAITRIIILSRWLAAQARDKSD